MKKSTFTYGILAGLLVPLVLHSAPASAQTIKTVVGGGFGGNSGCQSGTCLSIGTPGAVTVDPAGNLYIADATHGSVYAINSGTGRATLIAGNGTSGNAPPLRNPQGLAADANGNLFISDAAAGVVYKVPTSGGTSEIYAGCGTVNNPACSQFDNRYNVGENVSATLAFLNSPAGLSVDVHGNLFIADTNNCRVRKVDATTKIINTVAGGSTSPFLHPVCGSSGDGGSATSALLSNPTGVAVDSKGNIFIADKGNSRVREVVAGNISTVAGGGTEAFGPRLPYSWSQPAPVQATSLALASPQAIAVDSVGNLYIADTGNDRVLFVNTGTSAVTVEGGSNQVQPGYIQIIAGGGSIETNDTQNALIVRTANPAGLAVSGTAGGGVVYVALPSNFSIQALNLYSYTFYLNNYIWKYNIGTVAGNGAEDSIPDGTFGSTTLTAFQLGSPLAVTEDAASNIYVGETPGRVFEASPAEYAIKPIAGTGSRGSIQNVLQAPALSVQLPPPSSLFLDSKENVFLADDGLAVVDAGTGEILRAYPNPTAISSEGYFELGQIEGVTGDGADNVYFWTNASGQGGPPWNSVYSWNSVNKTATFLFGGGTCGVYSEGFNGCLHDNEPWANARFGDITGLCWAPGSVFSATSPVLFITDNVTDRVRAAYLASSGAVTVAGVAVQAGTINTLAGGGGKLPTYPWDHFYYKSVGDGGPATSAVIGPTGCFVDTLGNIYIADQYNDRIREVFGNNAYNVNNGNTPGNITTIAGDENGNPGFSGDGDPAANASLNYPNAIWGDQAGNLLISDSGNHVIREIFGILPVPGAIVYCDNCNTLGNASGSSAQATVTITNETVGSLSNTGIAPLIMSAPPALDPRSADSQYFTISLSTASPCPIGPPGLPPNASCTVTVTPTGKVSNGANEAQTNLVVYDNAYHSNANGPSGPTPDGSRLGQLSGYQQSLPITFTLTTPTVNVSPNSLLFTTVNEAQPITIQNTGSAILNVKSVTITSNAPFGFQADPPSDSCLKSEAGFPVQPGTECNIYVVFTGGTAMPNSAVTIVDDAATNTQSISLLGYALMPSGATSLSMSSSSPAPVKATFNVVGISCSERNPNCVAAICSVTPAGLDVNCTASGTIITATVSIPSCVQTGQVNLPVDGGGAGYVSAGIAVLALLLPWRLSNRKRLLAFMGLGLLFYVTTGLSACSSTSNVSSTCVASVPAGTTFDLSVTANPAATAQFPSLTNKTVVISVKK